MNQKHLFFSILSVLGFFAYTFTVQANSTHLTDPFAKEFVISVTTDTIPDLEDRTGDFISNPSTNPFDLNDPAIIQQEVEYDPLTNQYIITEKMGEEYFRPPTFMTFSEYMDYRAKQQEREYFNRLSGVSSGNRSESGKIDPIEKVDIKNSLIDRLFGGTEVDIRPQGSIDLTFGLDYQVIENPILTERQRRQGGFDFDMAIQMNVTGKIGEKLNLSTNYNTQATFDFDNQMKLDYDTDAFSEDEIIKKIEAGNVSLPLRGSLIQGSQSLFGLKTELQFGHLRITALASQQKSEQKDITIQGGSQFQEFEVFADEYDENRHFFLTHYNRDVFEESLEQLPQIRSLFTIERVDVWITNDRNVTAREGEPGPRDIVAVADLAEPLKRTTRDGIIPVDPMPRFRDVTGLRGLPSNDANDIYSRLIANPQARKIDRAIATLNSMGLQQARDFEKVSARRLKQGQEYDFHPQLGFISINVNVQPDQVLGVAFQYSYNGKTYKVGELYNDIPPTGTTADTNQIEQNVLFVKMLKSTTPRVDLPTWDLMMKNFYSIGAYQVNREDFLLDVFYEDPGQGQKRFLPESNLAGVPLLRVFNLDQLNVQGDPVPDGVFDFVPGLTINPRNGRIMFPVLEPFGSSLKNQITEPVFQEKYVYQQLYDSTVTRARERPELNRFTIRGSYRSSISSEISLGAFNIPRGSVRVTVGGQVLKEGSDYEIDYNIGRVRILRDDLLNSGAPIRVSFEDNTLFGFQTKTMVGLRADYELGDNFNIGATYLHLFERPYTQKVNIGDDPINNRIYGIDLNFNKDLPFLTKVVDAIPLVQTKAPSGLTFSAEAAALKPGHARAINEVNDDNKGGVVYLDDFEGSASTFDLRVPANAWVLASVPQNDEANKNPLFPEAQFIDNTISGVNRAQLNWYRIDRSARSDEDRGKIYTSAVDQNEVFPNRQVTPDQLPDIQTFDLMYCPEERGSYNFDPPEGTAYSAGLNIEGGLKQPETRWGGIMRALNTNDFEAANIGAIEFWMLSPFLDDANSAGKEGDLYFNLGNVSEDILRDSRKFFENGLPSPTNGDRKTDQTEWAKVPIGQQINYAFDNDPEARALQDVGLDGLMDQEERNHFNAYLQAINASPNLSAAAKQQIETDPSNDNYIYYNNGDFYDNNTSVLTRYSRYNHTDGNSPINQGEIRVSSATNIPDAEDLNRDNTLNETEAYFQYRVPLRADPTNPRELDWENNPYIIDRQMSEAPLLAEDGTQQRRVWYRFKIPLETPDKVSVGGIQDFRSIRFIRMYMQGFQQKTILRFARLELVRNQWRVYRQPLNDPGLLVDADGNNATTFDLTAVNFEDNADREPFPYALPDGIQREQSLGVFNALQNEQALSLRVCNLTDGDSRAIFKNINLDMRFYERLKMFVHAEESENQQIEPGQLSLFLRLGSDFVNNYYEYEVPLTMSNPDGIDTLSRTDYPNVLWLPDNELNFPLELFREAKQQRNTDNVALTDVFSLANTENPSHFVKVKGNPNLGYVKSVMIGVRNNDTNDGDTYCAEVWVNELRVNGLDERGGAAAIARMDVQLADLGNVTVSGNISTIGFGGLDQKLNDRSREEIKGFDIATNVELGKFLPEKSGIRIPFYAQYSTTVSTPEYDPYDLDIVLKDKIAETADAAARDSIRRTAQDVSTIRSYSFTNVRKERTNSDKKPMPWDISNFSVTYAHNQTEERDPLIESETTDDYRGAVDYSYSRPGKGLEPFKKLIKSNNKYLKIIKEINFNPLPNSFSFSTVMDRQLTVTKYRFTDLDEKFSTFHNKRFTWDRSYNLNWDIMRALRFNFNADMNTVIDELPHLRDDFTTTSEQERKDFIMDNIRDFGRPKNYQHNFTVNYTLPTKLIPFLDWMNIKAQYTGNYAWNAASLNAIHLGNIIQNQQNRSLTGDLNFEKLYNNSNYLKKINSPKRTTKKSSRKPSAKDNKKSSDKEAKGKDGKKKKTKKEREPTKIERALIRPLMLVRKGRFNYNESFSTVVPGFSPETRLLGLSEGFDAPGWNFVTGWQPNIRTLTENNYYSNNDWLYQASNNGWIVDTIFLNQQVQQTYSQSIDAKLTLEPFKDFRIDLEAAKDFSENHTQYFKDTTSIADRAIAREDFGFYNPVFAHAVPRNVGSMTISYFALNTLFQDSDEQITQLFEQFENNRLAISSRLGSGTHDDPNLAQLGYTDGYGRNQQDVLIPAFIAAYTGKDVSSIEIDRDYARNVLFKELPRINWKFSYNGLSRLSIFKDVFQNVSISHGYRSSLQVNSFNTSLDFLNELALSRDLLNDITLDRYSRLEIPEVVISEQFSPLLSIDVRTKNDMSFNVDFKKSRTLAMSFVSNQLAETQSEEYTFGFGYRLKNIDLPFLTKRKKKKGRKKPKEEETQDPNQRPQNNRRGGRGQAEARDLDLNFDFSLRNNVTFNHIMDQGIKEPTRGNREISISPSADYALNERLTLRFFFDYRRNVPRVSSSFPITNTMGGITVRFSLN